MALRRIHPRGGTNLSGGWLSGCQQVAEAIGRSNGARCLLMSDGQANQGITDPGDLERHARELQQRGVVTSTFGVGADFDERLMSGMARAGGGHGYFIREARQIGDLLTSELAESLEVVARGASLSDPRAQGREGGAAERLRCTAGERDDDRPPGQPGVGPVDDDRPQGDAARRRRGRGRRPHDSSRRRRGRARCASGGSALDVGLERAQRRAAERHGSRPEGREPVRGADAA